VKAPPSHGLLPLLQFWRLDQIGRRSSPPGRWYFVFSMCCSSPHRFAGRTDTPQFDWRPHGFQQGREIHIWVRLTPAKKIVVSLAGTSKDDNHKIPGAGGALRLPPCMRATFSLGVAGKKAILMQGRHDRRSLDRIGTIQHGLCAERVHGRGPGDPQSGLPEPPALQRSQEGSARPAGGHSPRLVVSLHPRYGQDFSAVAYYFAAILHSKLKVPIGIIEAAWLNHHRRMDRAGGGQAGPANRVDSRGWNRSEGDTFTPVEHLSIWYSMTLSSFQSPRSRQATSACQLR